MFSIRINNNNKKHDDICDEWNRESEKQKDSHTYTRAHTHRQQQKQVKPHNHIHIHISLSLSVLVSDCVDTAVCAVFHCKRTMDDKLSIKSSDSVTTSGEYEIVPEELDTMQSTQVGTTSPTLKIANNGDFNDLEKDLTEVIHELDEDPMPVDNADDIKTLAESVNEIEMGKCHVVYFLNDFLSFFHSANPID